MMEVFNIKNILIVFVRISLHNFSIAGVFYIFLFFEINLLIFLSETYSSTRSLLRESFMDFFEFPIRYFVFGFN